MWSKEDRAKYERRNLRYPSDLTDAEWALIESHIPPAQAWRASARGRRP